MKKSRMKRIGIMLAAVIAVAVLTACSQTTAGNQNAAGEANTIYGRVTAIDGNNITLALGTLNAGQRGTPSAGQNGQQEPQGTPPAMQDGQFPQGTPPAGQEGQAPQGTPSASGQGRQGGMLSLTGEEKTITIADESVISQQNSSSGKTGLAAISVGNTLKVVYDANDTGKITSIVVLGGMPQRTGESTPAVSPDASSGATPQASATPAATGA